MTRQRRSHSRGVSPESDWRRLTVPEFIERHCRKPLSKTLRVIVNGGRSDGGPPRRMGGLRSQSDVLRLRGVGPQSGAVIIRAMKRLGWKPRLAPLDISGALGSVADSLIKIAANARRLAARSPALAEELAPLEAQVRKAAAMPARRSDGAAHRTTDA